MPKKSEKQNKELVEEPKKWNVFIHNSDDVVEEFVIFTLMQILHKTEGVARVMTKSIQEKGKDLIGKFSFEIAETIVDRVDELSKLNNFPLEITMEIVK